MSFPFTHAEVFGSDPERLAGFYRAVLGWDVSKAEGVDYWRIAATEAAAPAPFAGGIARRPDFLPKGWLPYARVASVAACIEATQRLDGSVLRERSAVPRTGWYAVIADPEGNAVGLFEPDPNAFPLPIPD
jgi:predicted enzyme related to lactoylglutathione lyase